MPPILGHIIVIAVLLVVCFLSGRAAFLDIRNQLAGKGGCGSSSGCSGCSGGSCASCGGCSVPDGKRTGKARGI